MLDPDSRHGNQLRKKLDSLIVAPTTQINRRVEIYEQDGATLWEPVDIDLSGRLIDGSVTINGTSDSERRTGDVTLENLDGILTSHPGGFWYDKILKIYRGIDIPDTQPSIIIIQDVSGGASAFQAMLASFGLTNVSINLAARSLTFLQEFDVIVALGGTGNINSSSVTPVLEDLYALGKAIYTNGNDNTATHVPLITTTQVKGTSSPAYRIEPASSGHFITQGWVAEDESTDTGTLPTAIRAGASAVAQMTFASTLSYTAIAEETSLGGRWFHYHDSVYNVQARVMTRRAFTWLDDTRDRTTTYEYQLGEFMIDDITMPHEPGIVQVKFRDYVKKCKLNGFKTSVTFKKGTDLDVCIRALAANAGITKVAIGDTGKSLGHDFSFESGTDRWKAMKDLATSYGYDLYFTNTGVLVMPPFPDPALLSNYYTFKTGAMGNLASYEKSSNDSRIFNHIIVIGQSTNSVPVYGEAINNVAGSPTSTQELGDRVFRYNSSYITTAAQATATAKSLLAINALEEFSLNFSSVVIPWLEAGHVVNFEDPSPAAGDPVSFLLTDVTIPLGLGVMSSTAKRVRRVLS